MAMDLEPLLICKDDFKCIGVVAEHCNWEVLCTFIREQQNLSLLPKIGDCLYDMILRYRSGWCVSGTYEGDDIVKHFLYGGRYRACDGTFKTHFGLLRSLAHWSYGAYKYMGGIVDTPFGSVNKINQDSIPAEASVLKNINIAHRSNAEFYYAKTMDYLCSVKDCEPFNECKICECIRTCKCNYCKSNKGKTEQRRGVNFSNVSRY